MNIFVWRNNEAYGPFSRTEVFNCLARGEVTSDDFARMESDSDWRPLKEVLLASSEAVSTVEGIPELPMPSLDSAPSAGSETSEEIVDAGEFCETPAIKGASGEFVSPPVSDDTMGVLIWRNNEVFGPHSMEEVRGLLTEGELYQTDRLRLETDSVWQSVGSFFQTDIGNCRASVQTPFDLDQFDPSQQRTAQSRRMRAAGVGKSQSQACPAA